MKFLKIKLSNIKRFSKLSLTNFTSLSENRLKFKTGLTLMNPIVDILENEIKLIKSQKNYLNHKAIENTIELITRLDLNKRNFHDMSHKLKFEEYLILLKDNQLSLNFLKPIIIGACFLNCTENDIFSELIEKIIDENRGSIEPMEIVDCLYHLKMFCNRKDLYDFAFKKFISAIISKKKELFNEIYNGTLENIIKFIHVVAPICENNDQIYIDKLINVLIKDFSESLEKNHFNLLYSILEVKYFLILDKNVSLNKLFDFFSEKIRNDFSLFPPHVKMNFLSIFSENPKQSKNDKFFETAEKEILEDGFENYKLDEVVLISYYFSEIGKGSAQLFLDIENHLANNIDKLQPSSFFQLISSLSLSNNLREKFMLLLQKQIYDKHTEIDLSELISILGIYSRHFNNIFLFEKLDKYLCENLIKLSEENKLFLIRAYSKIYSNINSEKKIARFMVLSDLQSHFEKQMPNNFESKVLLLESFVILENNLTENLCQSILISNVDSSISYETCLSLYSSFSYLSSKGKKYSLKRFDDILINKFLHYEKKDFKLWINILTLLGNDESSQAINLLKKINVLEDDEKFYEKKSKLINDTKISGNEKI